MPLAHLREDAGRAGVATLTGGHCYRLTTTYAKLIPIKPALQRPLVRLPIVSE